MKNMINSSIFSWMRQIFNRCWQKCTYLKVLCRKLMLNYFKNSFCLRLVGMCSNRAQDSFLPLATLFSRSVIFKFWVIKTMSSGYVCWECTSPDIIAQDGVGYGQLHPRLAARRQVSGFKLMPGITFLATEVALPCHATNLLQNY
jgi:hypothetical protein